MPITNNSLNSIPIVPVKNSEDFRFLEEDFKIKFETANHINLVGVKAKHKLTFSTALERDNYYNELINDIYIIFDFEITKAINAQADNQDGQTTDDAIARGAEYYLILEANETGINYNTISLPAGGTYSQVTTGTANAYKENYQLVIFAVDTLNNLLFKRAYPFAENGGSLANWNIDFLDGIEPFVFNSVVPVSGPTNVLNKIETPVKLIRFIYAEGWQDENLNEGKFTLYNFETALEITASNAQLRTGEKLGSLENDTQFLRIFRLSSDWLFLNSFDRNYDYEIGKSSNDFLYFYIPNDEITSVQITTIVNYKNGSDSSHTETLPVESSGVYEFAAGTANNKIINDLGSTDNVYYYEIRMSLIDGVNNFGSETFTYYPQSCETIDLYFTNRFGVWQRMGFDSRKNKSLKLEQYRVERYSDGNTHTGGTTTNHITGASIFNVITNYQFSSIALKRHLEDFLMSEKLTFLDGKYYIANGDGDGYPIELMNDSTRLSFDFTTNHLV